MKNLNLTIMLLAMIIAAISITACSSNSDDDENGGGAVKGQKTLIVNDESFYATNCTAEQTRKNGMYLNIRASTEPEYCLVGHELVVHISPSKVAELKEGDVFENYNMSVQTFRRLNEIAVNSYEWEVLEGDISIKKITSMEMTIAINNLLLEHKISRVKRTIRGTAVLTSGTWDSNGNLLSFSDAIS